MKTCTKCKKEKSLDCFNKNKTRKDGLNNICRECSNKRSKKYYQENKEYHKKVIRKRSKKVILENRRKLFDFYTNNPCVDCGESNPIVLELDHRKGSEKHSEVSNMVGGGLSWATIEKEIEKCEVRCANCHRIKTAEQQGWYKDFLF